VDEKSSVTESFVRGAEITRHDNAAPYSIARVNIARLNSAASDQTVL